MAAETSHYTTLQPLPTPNRDAFMTDAEANMRAYGNVPYEIGDLIVGHVVDSETNAMAYKMRSDYVDGGSSAAAFRVTSHGQEEGILTASFTPAKGDTFPGKDPATDERLEALWRMRGVKGHVQLRAANRDRGLVVATPAPGQEIAAHAESIDPTKEHWQQLRGTALAMRRRRVGFDEKGDNIFWDPEAGFTIFDTHPVGLNPRRWVRPRRFVRSVQQAVQSHNAIKNGTAPRDYI